MKRIYAFSFFSECIPIVGVYAVMFAERQLSTLEISIAVAVWSVAKLVFEIPSGVVADRYDRRYVLVVSQLLTIATFLVWIAVPNIWGYSLGFVLWGAAGAFVSGTFEALLYDELAKRGKADRYESVLGKTETAYYLAVVVSGILASVLMRYGYNTLLWASCAAGVAGAITALTITKAPAREDVRDQSYFADVRTGIRQVLHVPVVARTVLYIAVTGCVVDLVTEYAPLFALDRDISPSIVALVMAALVLVMAAASAWVSRVPGTRLPVPVQIVIGALFLALATFPPAWPAIATLALCAAFTTATSVVARAQLQHQIGDNLRATTTSVGGFLQELMNIVGLVLFGLVANWVGRTDAFRYLAAAIALSGLALWTSRLRSQA